MAGIEKVLVAIDGSESSERALGMAISLTRQFNAQLKAVYVLRPPPVVPMAADGANVMILPPPPIGWSDGAERVASTANKMIAEASITGAAEVVRSNTESVADVILKTAKSFDADLIIVGHRGLGRLRRALIGSVSSSVLDGAECPVIIVK